MFLRFCVDCRKTHDRKFVVLVYFWGHDKKRHWSGFALARIIFVSFVVSTDQYYLWRSNRWNHCLMIRNNEVLSSTEIGDQHFWRLLLNVILDSCHLNLEFIFLEWRKLINFSLRSKVWKCAWTNMNFSDPKMICFKSFFDFKTKLLANFLKWLINIQSKSFNWSLKLKDLLHHLLDVCQQFIMMQVSHRFDRDLK